MLFVTIGLLIVQQNKSIVFADNQTEQLNLQENGHMHIELDSTGDEVPVPNGYVGSKSTGENEIDTGYVIYEGTEEVNDDNVEDAQKTRNQYVWIPVPDASKMYGTDVNGKKWGKLYEFTTDTGESIDQVTGARPLNWSESDGVMKIESDTNYREPDAIKQYDLDSIVKTLGLNAKTYYEFLIQLEKEFNNMIESVEKYGGFYIGRYETGDLSKEVVVVKKGNTDISNQTWYSMYNKCKKLSESNTNVETGMICGNQWDRSLMWLIETKNKTKEEICNNSNSWGNYKNSEFYYTNTDKSISIKKSGNPMLIPTGSTEYTKANNIYDLTGNVNEWSMETYRTDLRVCRTGNGYNNSGSASIRGGSYSTAPTYTCRMSFITIHKIKR